MRIEANRLAGDGVRFVPSPNDGGPFAAGAPDALVLHFTAGPDPEWALRLLCDPTPGRRVSCHLLVARDGAVIQLLPFDRIGWHTGRSAWGGRTEFNQLSLGIEIDNAGRLEARGGTYVSHLGHVYPGAEAVRATHRNESEPSWWHRYQENQVAVVEQLCRLLVTAYDLRFILGHEEIAPQRKDDPGPAFPLDELRQRVLGAPRAAAPLDEGPPREGPRRP